VVAPSNDLVNQFAAMRLRRSIWGCGRAGALVMWLRRCVGDVVASGALAVWLRGLRCVMVLAEVLGIKGASRPFGLEQVRPLTPTTSAREGRSYADPR